MVKAAEDNGLKLRQNYNRVAPRLAAQTGTDRLPAMAIVDKGYRGVEIEGVRILMSGQKRPIRAVDAGGQRCTDPRIR